jgi:tetratricopeptide (TPR) repeat protein
VRERRPDRAIELLTDYIRAHPESAEAYLRRGLASIQAERISSAIDDFRKADSLGETGRTKAALAFAYSMNGNHAEAVAHADAAEKLGFISAAVRNNRAYSRMQAGGQTHSEMSAAILDDLDQAILADSQMQAAYFNRAYFRFLVAQARTNESALLLAHQDAEAAVKFANPHHEVLRLSANILAFLSKQGSGEWDRAIVRLGDAIRAGSDPSGIRNNYYFKPVSHLSEFRILESIPKAAVVEKANPRLVCPIND